MLESVFAQIGMVLGLAVLGGALAQWLRQPLIIAFIGVGILLGPSGLSLVDNAPRSSCSPGLASPCCCSWWG